MERKLYKTEKIRDLRELVRRADRLFAEKIAYKEIGSNDEVFDYTFGRLKEDTDALGTKLFDMGMKGYHIAVLGENSYRWVVSYLSIVNGLGVVVPLDKEMTDDEIAMLINKSDSKSVICSDTYADALSGILPKCPAVEHAVVMNPSQEYENLLDMNVLIDEGKEIIKKLERSVKKQIVLRMPLGEVEQSETDIWGEDGKEWQKHRSAWLPEDFDGSWDILACRHYIYIRGDGVVNRAPTGEFYAIKNQTNTGPRVKINPFGQMLVTLYDIGIITAGLLLRLLPPRISEAIVRFVIGRWWRRVGV